MGKFVNTQYNDTVNELVDGIKNRMDNDYYLFNNKKGTFTDYYNQNMNASLLDEGTFTEYEPIGSESPLRFNFIQDAYICGLERIALNIQQGEWGVEADSVDGEGYILPNTFMPIPGDYFIIKYLEEKILFKVIDVSTDTLLNGGNFYKIIYKLEHNEIEKIKDLNKQVVDKFIMITNNDGTQFKHVIKKSEYNLVSKLQELTTDMKNYFIDLFFNNSIQTFSFNYENDLFFGKFYDSYMIEFLLRNKILAGSDDYIHLRHEAPIQKTFSLDYSKTFFYCIEKCKKENISNCTKAEGVLITDITSLMSTRSDDYYSIQYKISNSPFAQLVPIFPEELIYNIKNNIYFEDNDLYNIIIDYFNDSGMNDNIIEILENIDYEYSKESFFIIPTIIFIVEKYIKTLISNI